MMSATPITSGKYRSTLRSWRIPVSEIAAPTIIEPVRTKPSAPMSTPTAAAIFITLCGIIDYFKLREAASTTFLTNIARVNGPTPPGFGEIHPATFATSG